MESHESKKLCRSHAFYVIVPVLAPCMVTIELDVLPLIGNRAWQRTPETEPLVSEHPRRSHWRRPRRSEDVTGIISLPAAAWNV